MDKVFIVVREREEFDEYIGVFKYNYQATECINKEEQKHELNVRHWIKEEKLK